MRSAALSLLGITVLLLFLSHTFFFPAPAAAPVVHPKVSLLHGGHIPPEPDHRTKTKAPPSASPAAASAAGTPAAVNSRSTLPTVGATGTGTPGLGGHGPFGPESVAPYMPHGQEDRRCVPRREQALPSRPLNLTVPADSAEWPINCASFDGAAELCAAVKTAAVRREVMVGVANSNVQGQLAKWIEANRRAGISNMLIVAIDDRLPQWLESQKVACWPRPDKALGSHKISAQKFKFVRSFLMVGASVLMTDIDVVYLQNPFDHLWRDADIEGTTDGWDDGSAYGWLEQLDDPSLGAYGRFRPAMRITAWNSGLWYAAATHASLRLMTILAYRMEHEPNTWDQAAFGEEVARPARDGHHAAGIVKRALSYWCFANSKTVFRRLRAEAGSTHRPVVVHANYHQPKQPRMDAVYDRWHLGQADALGRFSTEPTAVVPAPELEVNSLHSINDGFVSGSDTRNALAAVKGGGCRPQPSLHGVRVSVAVLPVKACAPADAVCSAARDVAVRRGGGSSPPELLLLVVGASEAEPARLFLQSAAAAGVKNVLVACDGLVAALQGQGVTVVDASSDVPADASDASRVVRLRWALVRRLVEHGYGVLSAAAPTHLVSDPFDALYRDADVEAMTVGWDDPSSYGYNHVIDDPSMGFTRFCHGSRIVGYEPRLFFAMPTAESGRLARRMGERLGSAGSEGAARGGEAAGGSPYDRVARDEREAFVRELWLPSRNEYAHPGAVMRVMNYLCFANSKVLARQGQRVLASHKPVLLHIDYHADVVPRLRAAAAFLAGQADALRQLTAADTTTHAAARPPCAGAREWNGADEAAPAVRAAVDRSPWSWGGVPGFVFEAGGRLSTPWGPGQWGLHRGFEAALFADFIGTAHNIELSAGIAVATRCADDNIVLMRSVKGLDLPK